MKLFRRDAGPGQSEHALEVLRHEVARRGGADRVAFERRDDGHPFVVIDVDGVYHLMTVEQGVVLDDRTSTSRDDVLAWIFG